MIEVDLQGTGTTRVEEDGAEDKTTEGSISWIQQRSRIMKGEMTTATGE